MAGLIKLGKGRGFATRDYPNTILPTLADPIAPTVGTNWSWGAYKEVDPHVDYEFLLKQLVVTPALGGTFTTAAVNRIVNQEQFTVATGAAASEVDKAEAQLAESLYCSIGSLSGTVSVTIYGFTTRSLPCGPVVIPVGSRMAVRAVLDGAPTVKATRLYVVGYDTALLNFADVLALDELYERGARPLYPALIPLAGATAVTANALTPWAQGDYAVADAHLDYDYLIYAANIVPTNLTLNSAGAQVDLSLGAAGSEVVQARMALPGIAAAYNVAGHVEFPYPFIAYKGEQLSGRVAAKAVSPYNIGVYGVRLG